MVIPILIHGSEILTIKKQEAKTETAEMNYLRTVARYAWKDQIRLLKLGKNSIFVIDKMTKHEDAHSLDGRANIFFKRMEQTKHGLIHEDDANDEIEKKNQLGNRKEQITWSSQA